VIQIDNESIFLVLEQDETLKKINDLFDKEKYDIALERIELELRKD